MALVSFGLGVGLLVLARHVDASPTLEWLALSPSTEIGFFGIASDYIDGRDKEAREDERIRRLLKESAPEFWAAVVAGFAVSPEDLHRVATPEILDGIATNVFALRLGDRQFADEAHADVRDQAVRAPERWHDVQVKIGLVYR